MQLALERYRWAIAALFLVPLLVVVGYLIGERHGDPSSLVIDTSQPVTADVRVYVAGAVQHPGVYPIKPDSRWIDAVDAAGGPAADADLAAVNLAKRVHDEDQIVVPRTGGGSSPQTALVNINTASKADLMGLPGVGDVRAAGIIDSRSKNGVFAAIEDLVERGLVPQSVFDAIEALITVN